MASMFRSVIGSSETWIVVLACLVVSNGAIGSGPDPSRPTLVVRSESDGRHELFADVPSDLGSLETSLGFTDAALVFETGAGAIGEDFRWLTWSEDGEAVYASSTDGGRSWGSPRRFSQALRLPDTDVLPGQPMPEASIPMPATGRLFLVQARLPWHAPMALEVQRSGCEPLTYVHEQAYLVQCKSLVHAVTVSHLDFVQRVESFPCSLRLSSDLLEWLEEEVPEDPEETLRIRAVTVRPGPKRSLASFATALGVEVGTEGGGGSLIEFVVDRQQLRALICHDEIQYADRWQPPELYMNNVRADAGADWVEDPLNGAYCGTGVRGEVLDGGFDTDHQEYASRMVLHGSVKPNVVHGTATFGIVFAEGAVEPDAKGLLPCGTGIAGDFEDVTCGTCSRFDYTRESKETYQASFQSNSWGEGSVFEYGSVAYGMDEIAWRLDMAIFQAINNDGRNNPRVNAMEASAKNVVTVGGVNHEDTADTSDDWWCDRDCVALHGGNRLECLLDVYCDWDGSLCFDAYICGNIGPVEDGRTKPDLVYWIDWIFTTSTNPATGADTYMYLGGGTSAATPAVAGVGGLILEMWADTSSGGVNPWGHSPAGGSVFEKQPHASTLKALLINAAEQYPFSGSGHDLTRMHQGWGRPNARNALERANRSLVVDETEALQVGEKTSWSLEVVPGQPSLRGTLAYSDPPKTLATGGKELVNDLDLRVVSPVDELGNVNLYCGNTGLDVATASSPVWTGPPPAPDCDEPQVAAGRDALNNVENVFVEESAPGAGIRTGRWTVEVKAYEVNTDGHPNDTCRDIDLDPNDPEAGRAACEAAGCQWDGTRGVCGDAVYDVVFGLVVTGATVVPPGESDGLHVMANADGTLTLSWNGDCGGATRYGVLRGDLHAGYGSIAPEPGMCAVAATTATIPGGAGTADFFLVVPNDGVGEGSYGTDSTGIRRSPAAAPCYPTGTIDACAP